MSWNPRQRVARFMLGVALLACVLALARPQSAHAGWPLTTAARVSLGFGATYRSGDATSSSIHHGVDLVAEQGARVVAPLAGTVTFSGRVPSVGGGLVRAVTIATASGSVTLLPLDDVAAAKGDSLAEGALVGSLAETGDGSSAGTHLHVGLKRGDLYVDPLSVLAFVEPAAAPPAGAPAPAGANQQPRGSASAAAAASVGHVLEPGVRVASAAGAPTRAGAGAAAGLAGMSSASTPARSLRFAVPGARLAPGVSVGGAATRAQPSIASEVLDRALAPLDARLQRGAGADAQLAGGVVGDLYARTKAAAGHAAREAAVLGISILAAVGLLWPLWRRGGRKGSGEDRVSPLAEDVAAAVGRW